MDQKIKERLVGMAVLLFIAVLIIPFILDGQQPDTSEDQKLELPVPEPLTHSMDMAEGTLKRVSIPVPVSSQATQGSAISTSTSTPDQKTSVQDQSMPKPDKENSGQSPELSISPDLNETKQQSLPATLTKNEIERVAGDPGSAWVVQTGSFGQRNNAEKEVSRLKAKGFPAFLSRYTTQDNSIMYRVRVGPEKDRARAEKLMQRLSQAGVSGKVRAHP
ncbi:MAG: hypothetical protein HKN88_02645 [Gammaproteobacteria bacterium]|nr:SPOR domain-containing protein [Gammaproteobacteria bacterium]NNC96950.1 hypothetical protein [Gammaproteobacteria bacterium]NNM14580.1 hypothetical protein [Gammaproteobacteria bacterium]